MNQTVFDSPVFKKLARNDTGEASGHQGGIVIPRELRPYFPLLRGSATPGSPTIDHSIEAVLVADGNVNATVNTRYQYQTWGGTRSPESRLTANLGPIRNVARADDIVLFERRLDDPNAMRITLIRQGADEYQTISSLIGSRRWGVLNPAQKPTHQQEVIASLERLEQKGSQPFQIFETDVGRAQTQSTRVARDWAFRHRVLEVYQRRCCITNNGIVSPSGQVGIDAAHIVPRYLDGSDDVRNGLALSKDLHWAFDKGLFGIGPDRRVFVPQFIADKAENSSLAELSGQPIREASEPATRAVDAALEWHRRHIVIDVER